jgi:hypothetical protein
MLFVVIQKLLLLLLNCHAVVMHLSMLSTALLSPLCFYIKEFCVFHLCTFFDACFSLLLGIPAAARVGIYIILALLSFLISCST